MLSSNTEKFSQAISYIYKNLDNALTIEDVASKINISVASLKRLFQEAVEQSPGSFIRRMRMELAFRSLQDLNKSVLEIALESGFEDQAAFARSFKKIFGYPPREARQVLNIIGELDSIKLKEPEIIELNEITLQVFTKQGLYFESAPAAWDELKSRLTEQELSDDFSGLYVGIGHDNPHDGEVSADQVRFSAGVSHLSRTIAADSLTLSAGKYARFEYHGKPHKMGLAYHFIWGQWSSESEKCIDSERLAFTISSQFPDGMHAQERAIFVPLK